MRALLIIGFLSVHAVLQAQQPAYFLFAEKQFEGTDIYSVTQDKQGDYWFATDEGLFRHDGYEFFRVEHEEMNTVSLFNFVRDSKGTIYCNNLNHQVYKIENGRCSLIFVTTDSGSDLSLLVTPSDELIICTSRALYVLDKNHRLLHQSEQMNGYLSMPYRSEDGITFLQQSGTANLLVLNAHKKFEKRAIDPQLASSTFRFFKLKKLIYGIDCRSGDVYRVDPGSGTFTFITCIPHYTTKVAIRVYGIGEEMWIATSTGGVQRYRSEKDFLNPPPILFRDQLISHVFEDAEKNILLSTFDHGVMVVPNLKANDVISTLSPYDITRVETGPNGELFFGTRSGGLIAFDKDIRVLHDQGLRAIEAMRNPSKSPYLFSDFGGFTIEYLPEGKSISSNLGSFKNVVQSDENEFIVALNVGVIKVRVDGKKGKVEKTEELYAGRAYTVDLEQETDVLYISTRDGVLFRKGSHTPDTLKLKGQVVNAIHIQSLGDRSYISTRKKGLLCVRGGKIVSQLKPKFAGEDLIVMQFIFHEGQFFANTNRGFVVLNTRGKVLHILNKAVGLSTNKVIDFCIHKGKLWIVHSRGVQQFSLQAIGTVDYHPRIRLRELYVNDKRQKIRLLANHFESDQRKFRFILQVPTLRYRENTLYHYRLIGLDQKWHTQPYEHNQIVYNALAPGDYTLEIRAENNGNFGETVRYTFHISAPFYVRWWFISGCVVLFILLVFVIYRRQLAVQQKKAQQINELNASRLTAIQSQMNPHFIFNSLNSIQDLVLKGDVDNSYTFITKFSNLVRRTLNYSDKDFIEFEQEIKLIELYLSLEKLRFKEDLSYTLETNGIEDVLLPPMLIQPFIENALVHGLLHKEGLKKLSIRFELLEDILVCEIEDNGVGRKRAQAIKERQRGDHESFAVGAIKRRFSILQQHFGSTLGFTYQDLEEGTRVRITLPVRRNF